jgi:hypothetical protein
MAKLDLSRVTLIAATARDVPETIDAMRRCEDKADFANRLLFTPSRKHASTAEWCQCPDFQHVQELCPWSMVILPRWRHCFADFVLSVHWDGFIIDAASWSDEFMAYDFIGGHCTFENTRPSLDGQKFPVMNNGFYLSSRRFWWALEQLALPATEDACYPCESLIQGRYRKLLEDRGVKFAPPELAMKFSAAEKPWTNEFGAHSRIALSSAPLGEIKPGKLYDLMQRGTKPDDGVWKGYSAATGRIR